MRRRATHIADSEDDLHRAAFDIIGGRDDTTQMRGREIGPGGGEAGVELCHPPLIAGYGAEGNWSVLRQRRPNALVVFAISGRDVTTQPRGREIGPGGG